VIAAQLAQTSFVAGAAGASDDLIHTACDGNLLQPRRIPVFV
jgi:hypothetical protein